ncbi:MAG TPA: hypothetical protein VMS76_07695 [Planctomycetota bacterium]|nr:hypothetical protein [Planctomycetota bacterium]
MHVTARLRAGLPSLRRKDAHRAILRAFEAGVDPFSSGLGFDGWREAKPSVSVPSILPKARTWLLTLGWRRWGLISLDTVPRG